MGVVESSGSSRESPAGGRRIGAVAAVPIVLACGALGMVLGSIYPPDDRLISFSGSPVASHGPGKASPAATAPVAPTAAKPGPPAVLPPPIPPATPQQTKKLPAATPPPAAMDDASTSEPTPPERAEPNPVRAAGQPAQKKAAPDASPSVAARDETAEHTREDVKDTHKSLRKTGERRKRSAARSGRAKRQRYVQGEKPSPAPAGQSPGIISQIPIVGPVVGLILP